MIDRHVYYLSCVVTKVGLNMEQGGDEEGGKPSWRRHLERSSTLVTTMLRRGVADLHDREVADSVAHARCMSCHEPKYELDLVELKCFADRRPPQCPVPLESDGHHVICHRCLEQRIKRYDACLKAAEDRGESKMLSARTVRNLTGSLTGTAPVAMNSSTELPETYLRQLPVKIIPCFKCKSPNVLRVRTVFNESVLRTHGIDRNGLIREYTVESSATKVVQENYFVTGIYENQRRPFFGTFSCNNLLTLDFRGSFSTKSGIEVEHEHVFEKPNKNWVWVEVDDPQLTDSTGENGWLYYGFVWDQGKAEKNPDLFRFLRRRHLLSTRVRLSDAIREELEKLRQEEKRAARHVSSPSRRRTAKFNGGR